jgi:MFS family permease
MATFIGMFIFTFGIYFGSYEVILTGRIIFAIGGDNLVNVQMVCMEKWFRGSWLSMAMGLAMVFNYCGSILNAYFTPVLVEDLDPFRAIVLTMFVLTFSMMSGFGYILISMKYEHLLEAPKKIGADGCLERFLAEEEQKEKVGPIRGMLSLPTNYY